MNLFAAAGLAAVATGGSVAASAPGPVGTPIAVTSEGRVKGTLERGVAAYLGIPYAAPPTGELRWHSPLPAAKHRAVLDADRFGPSCPQGLSPNGFGPWTKEYVVPGPVSEDCLSLNVWAPAERGKKRPVLVWIHGGAFQSGGGSVPVYDGSSFARKGLVVVSVNYRLGVLGFFASPELREKGGGNFGLQDQIAALKWVKRNIAAFGGDPAQVTIAGQSAGGMSVHDLLLSPQAAHLFARAIPQSAVGLGIGSDMMVTPRDQAEAAAGTVLKALGTLSLDAARKLTADQVSSAAARSGLGMKFVPYSDGSVLPADPKAAFRAGRYNDVPLLMGMTAAEGSAGFSYHVTEQSAYEKLVEKRFGALAPDALRLYPWKGPETFPELLRDSGVAAVNLWAQERALTSRQPLYAYIFSHVEPGPKASVYGAFHTSEVPYVFGTLDKAPDRRFDAVDYRISDTVMRYWINFVSNGSPGGRGSAEWPSYGAAGKLLELGDQVREYPALSPERLALFKRQLENGGSLLVL